MSKQNLLGNAITVAVIVFGVALTAGLFSMVGSAVVDKSIDPIAQFNSSVAEQKVKIATPTLPPWQVIVGGIQRPASDVTLGGSGTRSQAAQSSSRKAKFDPNRPVPLKPEGGTPKVAMDENEQVAQVAEAIRSGKHPERYSSLIVPHNFDVSAFDSDPAGYAKLYASIVEPGRVFAPAQPADGVAALRSHGERLHRVVQGETVRLIAKAKANAPVTFSSFGFGQFENKLTSITVVADKEGLAIAPFTATSGTKNSINILAASPVMADQVKFVVSVKLP